MWSPTDDKGRPVGLWELDTRQHSTDCDELVARASFDSERVLPEHLLRRIVFAARRASRLREASLMFGIERFCEDEVVAHNLTG